MNDSKTTLELKQVFSQPYKYGFQTPVEVEQFPSGINAEIIQILSKKKKNHLF